MIFFFVNQQAPFTSDQMDTDVAASDGEVQEHNISIANNITAESNTEKQTNATQTSTEN